MSSSDPEGQGCKHDIIFHGLCATCGENVDRLFAIPVAFLIPLLTPLLLTPTPSSHRVRYGKAPKQMASTRILHDTADLTVTEEVAARETKTEIQRLRKERRLALFCDLDQTLIHADTDITLKAWLEEGEANINYPAIKDVHTLRFPDDPNTYFIKPRGAKEVGALEIIADSILPCHVMPSHPHLCTVRPGVEEFLKQVSSMYELHVYTAGNRTYAQAVAKILDPTGRYFSNRILHREANESALTKDIGRIFPGDASMAVAMDDRADVWNFSRNLLKVKPFRFYPHVGDINNPVSTMPKNRVLQGDEEDKDLEELEKKQESQGKEDDHQEGTAQNEDPERQVQMTPSSSDEKEQNDPANQGQGEETRPVKRSIDGQAKAEKDQGTPEPSSSPAQPERKASSKVEGPLVTLQRLKGPNEPILHTSDQDLLRVCLPRLRSLHVKFFHSLDESGKATVCDALREMRQSTLKGVTLCLDGSLDRLAQGGGPRVKDLFPDPRQLLVEGAEWIGAEVETDILRNLTHYITRDPKSPGVRELLRLRQSKGGSYKEIHVVQDGWLRQCIDRWSRVPEADFPILNIPGGYGEDEDVGEEEEEEEEEEGSNGDIGGREGRNEETWTALQQRDGKRRRVSSSSGGLEDDGDTEATGEEDESSSVGNIDWESAWKDIEEELGSDLDADDDDGDDGGDDLVGEGGSLYMNGNEEGGNGEEGEKDDDDDDQESPAYYSEEKALDDQGKGHVYSSRDVPMTDHDTEGTSDEDSAEDTDDLEAMLQRGLETRDGPNE
ncbi:MAG: hypothetical protein DHS80DRAFT_25239 [Piptocephalis tieghemiana]|nr:MAG: hypothetical protein DHS80DRAFT_25239 [Piptocephalis tieghemiana]